MAEREQKPCAYTVTMTWSLDVTVIALSADDAADLAAAEMSRSDTDDEPYVDVSVGFDIAELNGPDTLLVADLSAAGIDEEDHPGETEREWGEWARLRGADTPLKERLKAARRVLGAASPVSEGQLDVRTAPMFGRKVGGS